MGRRGLPDAPHPQLPATAVQNPEVGGPGQEYMIAALRVEPGCINPSSEEHPSHTKQMCTKHVLATVAISTRNGSLQGQKDEVHAHSGHHSSTLETGALCSYL
jgi:hypothetical protein